MDELGIEMAASEISYNVDEALAIADKLGYPVVLRPAYTMGGKVIGFGGRILTSDKTKAKYLNSPESEIYNKSQTLYGIYFAKNEISRQDRCILVEGYADVLSMHQAGMKWVMHQHFQYSCSL